MENLKKELETESFDMKTVEKIFELYFNGQPNIITPYVYGFDALLTPSRICLFEKSSNREDTLFAVTTLCYDRTNRNIRRIDLNYVADTPADIDSYIKQTTLYSVETGDLYGRII